MADDLTERTIRKLSALPYDTTSSMQADFAKGHEAEWKSLTEYVVVQSRPFGLDAAMYTFMLKQLVPSWKA